jgi:hypothetical protein
VSLIQTAREEATGLSILYPGRRVTGAMRDRAVDPGTSVGLNPQRLTRTRTASDEM